MTPQNENIIVINIDDSNVDEFAKNMHLKNHVFIAFLADWCHHCKAVKPAWEKAKEKLSKIKGEGHVVTVSEKHMGSLPCKQPSGFPSFMHFKGNEHLKDYDGGRNMEDFVKIISQYMKKSGKPKSGKSVNHVGGKRAKRKGVKRKGTKRKGTRRKGTKRKGTKRKGAKRKGTKRKGTKRKGTKRKRRR
tara:strand:- start:2504 stop:3070 length:567 start_codon:yes stop_codon:yes gene_type:complete